MGRYIELSRDVLLTKHAKQQLLIRYGDSVEKFVSKLGNKLQTLYKLCPNHKQICLTVAGYKIVLEKMLDNGVRCPDTVPEGRECYLVIVTILSPSMTWRGDRSKSKRVRKQLV